MSSIFVAAVTSSAAAERSTVEQELSSTTSSDNEDYGYQTVNVHQAASGNVSDTLVETRANRVKVEALHFLDDRSKVLQTLSSYSNIYSTFLKYNTSLPSSAPVERFFSIGRINPDSMK